MRGDKKGAQAAFAAARLEVEKAVLADASDGLALSLLAMIDAGLGRQEQAVQEAKHACELETFENFAPNAAIVRCNLAVVYAWNGQLDLAISELDQSVSRPAGTNLPAQPTYGDFRRNPLWDPLRNDPRFTAIMKAARTRRIQIRLLQSQEGTDVAEQSRLCPRSQYSEENLRFPEMSIFERLRKMVWRQIQAPKAQAGTFPSGSSSQVRCSVFCSASWPRRFFVDD